MTTYNRMTRAELSELCKLFGLDSSGTRPRMKARLEDYFWDNDISNNNGRVNNSKLLAHISEKRLQKQNDEIIKQDREYFHKHHLVKLDPHKITPRKQLYSLDYTFNPFRKIKLPTVSNLREYAYNPITRLNIAKQLYKNHMNPKATDDDFYHEFVTKHPDFSFEKQADSGTISQIADDLQLDESGIGESYRVDFGAFNQSPQNMKYILEQILHKIDYIKQHSAYNQLWRARIIWKDADMKSSSLPIVNYRLSTEPFIEILLQTLKNFTSFASKDDHTANYQAIESYLRSSSFNYAEETPGLNIRNVDAIILENLYKRNEGSSRKKKVNKGGFLGYVFDLSKLDEDLLLFEKEIRGWFKVCQFFHDLNNVPDELIRDNCFIHALSHAGIPSVIIEKLRMQCRTYYVKPKFFHDILAEYGINVRLYRVNRERTNEKNKYQQISNVVRDLSYIGCPETEAEYKVKMFVFEEHYFINAAVTIPQCHNTADLLLRLLPLARVLTIAEYEVFKLPYYKHYVHNITSLEYNSQHLRPYVVSQPAKSPATKLYFVIDFECTQDESIHKPFMVCIQQFANEVGGKFKLLSNTSIETFKNEDCSLQMMEYFVKLANKNKWQNVKRDPISKAVISKTMEPAQIMLYIHNLAYDMKFYANYGIRSSVKKGNTWYQFTQTYKQVTIISRDILKLLKYKLADFGTIFKLDVEKECMPYEFYTYERLKEAPIAHIDEVFAITYKPAWDKEKMERFANNIIESDSNIGDKCFDMWKYAQYYCEKDVEVTVKGLSKFYDMIMGDFGINIFKTLTISSLAKQILEQRVYTYIASNLYEYSTHMKLFMDKAIYGGRTMCAYNKKWHTNIRLADFDAVSLYPSAMARMKIQLGKPTVKEFDSSVIRSEPLGEGNSYIIEIDIVEVGKTYPFPLICQKSPDGNEWEDRYNILNNKPITEENPIHMTVDNIYLEDLCKYSHIKYKAIRGYVWYDELSDTLAPVIRELFEKRKEYKQENNPIQEAYKLILNSLYGKTIEKFHDSETIYKVDNIRSTGGDTVNRYQKLITSPKNKILTDVDIGDNMHRVSFTNAKGDIKIVEVKDKDITKPVTTRNEYEDYIQRNYQFIIADNEINNSNIHEINILSPVDETFTLSLLGVQILSMSKRIMNEVMCLAYDTGCRIYYQDTDSMHISEEDLEQKLAPAYKDLYGRELIGKDLGQFHCDFSAGDFKDPIAVESIFLMKKFYIDKLVDKSGKQDVYKYHIRCKGITNESMDALVEKEFKNDVMSVYEYLFKHNDNILTFDLLDGKTRFKHNADMTISTLEKFTRKVHCTYDEGDINNYFTL